MTTRPLALAGRLRAGERLRLLFVKMPCPAEIELAGAAGFDGVIVDTEHGTADGLEHHLRAADAAGIPALVRVPAADPGPILRALDAGAAGIVVAHATDTGVAEAAVAAAHYPPRGRRGLALTTRAGRYGTTSLGEHLERAAEETLVVVQIEDAEAVPRSDEILAVDGVDAVLIGVTDLSASLGHPTDAEHPAVTGAVSTITAAAAARGVPVAMVAGSGGVDNRAQLAVFVSTLLIRDAFRSAAAPLGSGGHPGVVPEPLVLLPGMLGTADLWDEVAPALSELVPLRFGRIDFDSSIEEMAASVLAASPERFALAGHSLGAVVALSVVRRAPQRVTRLALLNSSAQAPTSEQLAAWDELERQALEDSFAKLASGFARANLAEQRRGDEALHKRIEAMALATGPRALLRQLAAQRTRTDSLADLVTIDCPTLVLSGAEDAVSPPDRQQELAAAIPGAQLELLEGVGHLSPLEAPEAVAAALVGWIR